MIERPAFDSERAQRFEDFGINPGVSASGRVGSLLHA